MGEGAEAGEFVVGQCPGEFGAGGDGGEDVETDAVFDGFAAGEGESGRQDVCARRENVDEPQDRVDLELGCGLCGGQREAETNGSRP